MPRKTDEDFTDRLGQAQPQLERHWQAMLAQNPAEVPEFPMWDFTRAAMMFELGRKFGRQYELKAEPHGDAGHVHNREWPSDPAP